METTWNHPFWVANENAWVEAKDLKVGDFVFLADGKTAFIHGIKHKEVNLTKIYNFEVEDNHTYFVGDDGVVVHNYVAQIIAGALIGAGAETVGQIGKQLLETNEVDIRKLDEKKIMISGAIGMAASIGASTLATTMINRGIAGGLLSNTAANAVTGVAGSVASTTIDNARNGKPLSEGTVQAAAIGFGLSVAGGFATAPSVSYNVNRILLPNALSPIKTTTISSIKPPPSSVSGAVNTIIEMIGQGFSVYSNYKEPKNSRGICNVNMTCLKTTPNYNIR